MMTTETPFCLSASRTATIPSLGGSRKGPVIFDGIPSLPSTDSAHSPGTRQLRDVAVVAIPDTAGFQVSQVIDLTAKMDAKGHLIWSPPAGKWKILRFLQVPTGARNGFGYYSDAMSAEALDQTWAVTLAPLLKEM